MDYFIDVLTNFLRLECFSRVAVYAGLKALRFALICAPKMNEGLTGLERG